MKAYMVSMGHIPRMHSAHWLERTGLDVTVVTHHRDQARDIRKRMPYAEVIATGKEGLLASRNFILDELVEPNAWYIGLDDNIAQFTTVNRRYIKSEKLDVMGPPPNGFASWRQVYRALMDPSRLPDYLDALRGMCSIKRTIYGGFASCENPMFRQSHLSYRRFVKSKIFVMCNRPGLQWGGGDYAHDSHMTAQAVALCGSVVVNNYVHAVHPQYEEGGLGTIKDRRPLLDKALEKIVAEFPGLVAKAKGANSALRFTKVTDRSVAAWRKAHGYL